MMYLGDFFAGRTVRFMWSTAGANGASITRATNGTVSVYKDLGTTQSTTGVTDTEDFDSLTGVHACAIDTSADTTFYSAGSEFTVVLSAATIDGQTVNAVLAHFSLQRDLERYGVIDTGTAQSATGTTLRLRSGFSATNDVLIGATILVYDSTNGRWERRVITDWDNTSKDATVDTWTQTPSGTIRYIVFATPPSQAGAVFNANVTQISGDAGAADTLEAVLDGTGGTIVANLTGNVSGSVGSVTGAVGSVTAGVTATAVHADVVDAIWDDPVDGAVTARQSLRLANAALGGKASGLATATATYRDLADSKNRLVATVDANGNRTAVTRDLT